MSAASAWRSPFNVRPSQPADDRTDAIQRQSKKFLLFLLFVELPHEKAGSTNDGAQE